MNTSAKRTGGANCYCQPYNGRQRKFGHGKITCRYHSEKNDAKEKATSDYVLKMKGMD